VDRIILDANPETRILKRRRWDSYGCPRRSVVAVDDFVTVVTPQFFNSTTFCIAAPIYTLQINLESPCSNRIQQVLVRDQVSYPTLPSEVHGAALRTHENNGDEFPPNHRANRRPSKSPSLRAKSSNDQPAELAGCSIASPATPLKSLPNESRPGFLLSWRSDKGQPQRSLSRRHW